MNETLDESKVLAAPKPFWQSRTVIGIFAMILSQVLKHWQLDVLPADIGDIVTQTLDYGGAMLAIYGRIKATAPINGTANAAEAVEIRKAVAVDPVLQRKIEGARRAANPKA